jgi:hypothetical protein
VHRNATKAAEHTSGVDALTTAFAIAGDQCVRAGTGAVHPVQLACHAQACLVETGHLGLGDTLFNQLEEFLQPVGRALGHRPHGALRDRGVEQLGQRGRGAFLG